MADLMQASNEWANRPEDERFEKLDQLYLHTLFAAQRAKAKTVPTKSLRVMEQNGNVLLDNGTNFSNWSFGQLARQVGAPLDWLRRVPADLAVTNLNYALENAEDESRSQLWVDDTTNHLRAATGPGYTRVLNHEVVKAVIGLGDEWLTPPARPCKEGQKGSRKATEADVHGSNHPDLGVKVGDWIAPAGIYGSDRNIFVFRVNPNLRLDDGTDGGLGRGFFVRNSEVGDGSFELTTFWYRYVCGNHIVWGAEHVAQKKFKHVGKVRTRAFDSIRIDLDIIAKADLKADADYIDRAKKLFLGSDETEIIQTVFSDRKLMTKKAVEASFALAEENEATDGDPTTAWGFAQGVTRLSQRSPYADERTRLDRAAGEILSLASAN